MIYAALIMALVIRPRLDAFTFVFVSVMHLVVSERFSDPYYYLSAALFDLFVISFFASMDMVTAKTLQLQTLSVISLIVNFIGWIMWTMYIDPMIYNATFSALYLTALIIILQKDDGANGIGNNRLYARIHRFISAWDMVARQYGKTP